MRDNVMRVCNWMFVLTCGKSKVIKLSLPLQELKTKHKEIENEYFINRARRSELGERNKMCIRNSTHSCLWTWKSIKTFQSTTSNKTEEENQFNDMKFLRFARRRANDGDDASLTVSICYVLLCTTFRISIFKWHSYYDDNLCLSSFSIVSFTSTSERGD